MKKSVFIKLIFSGLILTVLSALTLPDDALDGIISGLEKLRTESPQEKVHLHFDKDFYSVGEDMWFKAYIVNAEKNEPSALSKVLYVDVIDNTDTVRKTVVLPITNGLTHGDINLNDTLFKAGNYHVRAYTKWMRNFDAGYFFDKAILIGDAFNADNSRQQVAKPATVKNDFNVSFYPEGGALINGLRSKVAFKALGNSGSSIKAKGFVEDEKGQKIVEFETDFAGMGVFALRPEAGHKYVAVVERSDHQQRRYPLPAAEISGYVIGLNHRDGDSLAISVAATADLTGKEMILVAQQNATLQYVTRFKMDAPLVTSYLPKKRFRDGIVQFTLFTAEGTPTAERLIFAGQRKNLTVGATADQKFYSKRQKATINLNVSSNEGNPVNGNFSVAVTDEGTVQVNEDDEVTIQSNLLLTSDLKGTIEKPNYYFTTVDKAKVRRLDALMLTQGWRRFKWADVQAGKFTPPQFMPEQGLTVSGTITTLAGKPMPNGKVMLFAPTKDGPFLTDTVADANGRFLFNNLDFADSTKFVVRAKSAKERNNVRIKLDNDGVPVTHQSFVSMQPLDAEATGSFTNYIEHTAKRFLQLRQNGQMKPVQLKTVIIKDKAPPKIFNSVLSKNVQADYTLTPDKLQSAGYITALLGGLGGVTIKRNNIFGFGRSGGRMIVLLDGNVMDDLGGINPASLAGVQIVRGGATSISLGTMLGLATGATAEGSDTPSAYNGIVYLTTETRRTKYNSSTITALSRVAPMGYALTREFYSPAYDVPTTKEKGADLRSTIYWKPDLVTGNDGKTSFSFFTADAPGNYRVVIEGLDNNGNLARQVSHIVVR